MNLESSAGAFRQRRSHGWRTALGGLGLVVLSACVTQRSDLCATLHTRMLEEMRTTEEAPRHVSDAWACRKHEQRLRQLARELRAMEVQDAKLRQAVEDYRMALERLAQDYARLLEAHRKQGPPAEQVLEVLGSRLMEHADAVSSARARLRNACESF